MKFGLGVRAFIAQFIGLVLLVALWAWVTNRGAVSPVLMPDPHLVFARLPELLVDSVMWRHVGITVFEILAAFLWAAAVGIAAGIAGSRSARAAAFIDPVLRWMQTVPVILLYPLCLLFFGVGPASKIAFGAVCAVFPIAMNTLTGLRTVKQAYLTAGRSLGASPRQLMWQIWLPAARPMIVAGVRMGASMALLCVIAAEMLASYSGVGYQITAAAQRFHIVDLYAYILIALLMIITFNAVIGRTEKVLG